MKMPKSLTAKAQYGGPQHPPRAAAQSISRYLPSDSANSHRFKHRRFRQVIVCAGEQQLAMLSTPSTVGVMSPIVPLTAARSPALEHRIISHRTTRFFSGFVGIEQGITCHHRPRYGIAPIADGSQHFTCRAMLGQSNQVGSNLKAKTSHHISTTTPSRAGEG